MSSVEDEALAKARLARARSFKIFIYCDAASHAPRRVAVTNFIAVPGGGWHEQPASRASTGPVGTGRQMIGDTPAVPGWSNDPEVSNGDLRARHELTCRKCNGSGRRVAVVARAETLFMLLDGWRSAGVLEVPLSQVAATLSEKPGN